MVNYNEKANVFKALSDGNRLKIIDILSCGERCACKILEFFDFTQPTLSHHMKVLAEIGLVRIRKEGKWNHYSLNLEKYEDILNFLDHIFYEKEDCICRVIDQAEKLQAQVKV
ncbi:MAG: winged helix-turn-helix transcriptional regulator [Firmicutes bacterium]|jgi:ArsR family transcriptional regulator|nr:winged helix-turn-helix transcriptional regulator [Bacillota bacterium]